MKTVYDVGMHTGEDTDYYLKKGFRVVGVEANPALAQACADRFADAVASGQLTIVNKAVAETSGTIAFYVSDQRSVWGTASLDWKIRNDAVGQTSHAIDVPASPFGEILDQHGTPYYLKIDIEGFDHLCIDALIGRSELPDYVSIESHATDREQTFGPLRTLRDLGYGDFQIVSQEGVPTQSPPQPSETSTNVEGNAIDYTFEKGSSGMFGLDLPDHWLSFDDACAEYTRIYRHTRLVGPHNGLLRHLTKYPWPRRFARPLLGRGFDWYDTHARR